MSQAAKARKAYTKSDIDEAFVRRSVAQSNLNALRMALFQQTGDPQLTKVGIEMQELQGGAFRAYSVAADDRSRITDYAVNFLLKQKFRKIRPPSRDEARELMEVFIGRSISDAEFNYGYEELAFEDFPRRSEWTDGIPREKLEDFSVAIIGAGFSGIGIAVQLERLGIPYQIFDRQSGIGGTWELNDYPQARVDITTFLYQYKFEKNYPWKSHFATQKELKEYIQHIAAKYGVAPHIHLETHVTDARWDEDSKRWKLNLIGPDGPFEHAANVIVSCSGLFSTPRLPGIPGIREFEGKMFHTTDWDHSFDLDGKAIALIGTGSTGCQLAPEIAERAKQFTVYQRTPSWITPVRGYRSTVSPEKRWLFDNLPGYWNWFVYSAYVAEAQVQGLQDLDPNWIAKGGVVNERNTAFRQTLTDYIYSKFPDRPHIAEKCIPSYPPVARRLVIDNGWYDALARDNVDLVTDGIEQITTNGILGRDGKERKFDLIILGAGFEVSKFLWPVNYVGRDGATPKKLWEKDGARAFLGLTLPGLPNFFVCYGPNSQSRAGGFHDWAEIWSRYIGDLMVHMIEHDLSAMEVRKEKYVEYNNAMDERNKQLLWETEGVGGYYVNEYGRSGIKMPWTMHEFFEMVRKPDPNDYEWTY